MDQETKSEFNNINQRLDTVFEFLRQHMVTRQELDESLADLRSDVATKEELRALIKSVDAFAKLGKDYFQEVAVVGARVTRMEAWIEQAAKQIGVQYKL